MAGRHCEKRLFLQVHHRNLAKPLTDSERTRMELGNTLGRMSRRLWPQGVLVQTIPGDEQSVALETQQLIESGASVLFEAGFLVDDLFVRCDVLERTESGWLLTEVKSSTKVKDEHLEDLAFQVHVLGRTGIEVQATHLCHVNNSSVRGSSALEPHELFAKQDVTREVFKVLPNVEKMALAFQESLSQSVAPDVRINTHCDSPYRCPFFDYCHVGRPENDITDLPGIKKSAVLTFHQSGVETIEDIPNGARLTADQRRARNVIKFQQPFVGDSLIERLSHIKFPAHFIDFEAANPALPLHPGMRPFQAFPFQWSDHVLDAPDAEPRHREFLHVTGGDPRPEFTKSLINALEGAQTVVFYSNYEVTTVKALVKDEVESAEHLLDTLVGRGIDLYPIVKDGVYLAEFRGSYSIKAVLPALVPGLDYSSLTIADGDAAATEYLRMIGPGSNEAEKAEIARNLLDYCRLDTLAMVEIFRALLNLAQRNA